MSEAQQIGQVVKLPLRETTATDSIGRLTEWEASDLDVLPSRLDDRTFQAVRKLSREPLPPLPPCDEVHFSMCFRVISILPRKADDDLTGEVRAKLYRRILGEYPADALSYLSESAIRTCDWFPTPHQCLDILSGWSRNDKYTRIRNRAATLARSEGEARFAELCEDVAQRKLSQQQIDGLPLRTKDILYNRFLLRRSGDAFTYPAAESMEGATPCP